MRSAIPFWIAGIPAAIIILVLATGAVIGIVWWLLTSVFMVGKPEEPDEKRKRNS